MALMSLIVAMGTIFSFHPAGAVGKDHQRDQDQPRAQQQQRDSRDQQDQQQRRDQDQTQQRDQQRQRDQDQQQNHRRENCDPRYDDNCECERQESQDQRQQRQDLNQDQNQNQQRDQNQDQQQNRQDQRRNDEQQNRRVQPQSVAATSSSLQHDHDYEQMDLSSFYFDSGWVSVRSGTNYMFNHNFGSIPSYVVVHQCGQLDKNNECVGDVVIAGERGYQDGSALINPIQITSDKDSLEVVLGNFYAWGIWNPQRGWECPQDEDKDCNTAYYRIQAFK